MLLLDTCVLLWITSDPEKLSSEATSLILQHSTNLFVSAISAFEIGVKERKGLLKLPAEPNKWWSSALDFHGISEIALTADIALQSTRLPPLHRDPCDRMILATSQAHALILLSPDPLLLQYSGYKVTW